MIRTIDAHVGGQSLRLVVDGLPRPRGRSAADHRGWFRRHADELRRAIVLEPRGGEGTSAAVLTESGAPGAEAGVVFMDAGGYPPMSGHGIIGAATIAVARGILPAREHGDGDVHLALDTPAGPVDARVRVNDQGASRRVDVVAYTGPASFVHTPAHPVRLAARTVRVDLAYGGVFYAIVDTEAVGVPLEITRLPELRRLAVDLCAALNRSHPVVHPQGRPADGTAGVIFTGPARDPEAHLRSVLVTAGGAVDRCPSGTGTAAVMAVLDAMGLLPDGHPFVHESLTGSLLRGRTLRRTTVGDAGAIVAAIEGSAWLTGEHTFYLDDDDPFREGFGVFP